MLSATISNAQDSAAKSVGAIPGKIYSSLFDKSNHVEEKLDKATEKYLNKLFKQELKLKNKIAKKDSLKAKELFDGLEEKYAALKNAPQKLSKYRSVYNGHLDSLTTALRFLKGTDLSNPEIQKTLSQFSSLQDKLNQTENIKKFLNERKKLLKENLESLGMLKELKGFSRQAYYYSAQVKELKAMWQDPSRLEKKLLELVMKTDKFKEFFRNNSQLASLFALPGSSPVGGGQVGASMQGLQTRASVQNILQARFGTGANVQQQLQQNMQAAQGQLNQLKNKLAQLNSGSFGNSNSIDVPEGFKPNQQKAKTFLQRLEYGANIQNQKASSYFPTTSDLGLSLGYKLNDKSSLGVGASYKLGWGRGWDHIRLSHEGVGLRSYLDYKLKGSLYISGGYEQNYRPLLRTLIIFSPIGGGQKGAAWQTSGLLGLSKKYKISSPRRGRLGGGLKGEMKLLWDFMSYRQIPRTQTILFRIGYNLK